MNREKNKLIITFSLFGMICFMSVAFALLSTNLTINGTGRVESSSWNINFASLSAPVTVGEAKQLVSPTLNSTSITGFSVSLRKPNDSIYYNFSIVNSGDYDAVIDSIQILSPTCVGNGTYAATDANNVCKYLSYTLTYDDGKSISNGDSLKSGETKRVKLEVTYGNEDVVASELPKSDVSISNLGINIKYIQS